MTSVPSDVLTPTRSGAGLGVAVPRRRARSRARRAETRAFYICISPWIVGFILFTAGPIGYLLYLSLTNQHTPFTAGQYIGMENYRNAFQTLPSAWQLKTLSTTWQSWFPRPYASHWR